MSKLKETNAKHLAQLMLQSLPQAVNNKVALAAVEILQTQLQEPEIHCYDLEDYYRDEKDELLKDHRNYNTYSSHDDEIPFDEELQSLLEERDLVVFTRGAVTDDMIIAKLREEFQDELAKWREEQAEEESDEAPPLAS